MSFNACSAVVPGGNWTNPVFEGASRWLSTRTSNLPAGASAGTVESVSVRVTANSGNPRSVSRSTPALGTGVASCAIARTGTAMSRATNRADARRRDMLDLQHVAARQSNSARLVDSMGGKAHVKRVPSADCRVISQSRRELRRLVGDNRFGDRDPVAPRAHEALLRRGGESVLATLLSATAV